MVMSKHAVPQPTRVAYATGIAGMCISNGASSSESQNWRGFSVIGRTQFMYRFDQHLDIFGGRKARHPVSKIEYVSVTVAVMCEYGRHTLAYPFRPREQHRGLEIALQCNARAHS